MKKKKEEIKKSPKTLIATIIVVLGLFSFSIIIFSEGPLTGNVIDEEGNLNTSYLPGELPVPIDYNVESKHYYVDIVNFIYSPSNLKIKSGDIVTWENKDITNHSITSLSGTELNSKLLKKGERYSHRFENIGTYKYASKPHPFVSGIIIVE